MRGFWGFYSTVYLIIMVRDEKGKVGFSSIVRVLIEGLTLKQHGKGTGLGQTHLLPEMV